MRERRPIDLGTTVAGVRLPFCVMNGAGIFSSADELRALAASASGAIVTGPTTTHPFVHPAYRSLHNPGYDRLVPLVRELAAASDRPVVASIVGATADEYVLLARAFAEAGAVIVEANLAEPYVGATLAPLDDADVLRTLLRPLVAACAVPVAVRLPERIGLPYARVGEVLLTTGVRAVVLKNDFATFEKMLLAVRGPLDFVPAGGIRSGYDVRRALAKGARAVQIGPGLAADGPAVFARLEREMRIAAGERPC
jgi:dihydroorotate dehydrogenase